MKRKPEILRRWEKTAERKTTKTVKMRERKEVSEKRKGGGVKKYTVSPRRGKHEEE